MELKFKRQVTFTGRNGTFKCIGVNINNWHPDIAIIPITSKDKSGHCCIEIPKEELSNFVDLLKQYI